MTSLMFMLWISGKIQGQDALKWTDKASSLSFAGQKDSVI